MDYLDAHERELDQRHKTFRQALDLLTQRGGKVIVETGCVRLDNDWGAGMSTVIFADWCKRNDGVFYSVDNNKRHLGTAYQILKAHDLTAHCTFIESDSVAWLRQVGEQSVDCLYLDSLDFPYLELLQLYGYQDRPNDAIHHLWELTEEEVLERHGDLVIPCQDHCLAELLAAGHALKDTSIVLMDDWHFPGQGKVRMARAALAQFGWKELSKWGDQQSLWINQ